jgi:chromate reductase
VHVLVLVGSDRPDSFNSLLADHAARALPPGSEVARYDGLYDLPFYTESADLDPPAQVLALREAIRGADALVVTTPEFNASPPAVLKNAIDWASRPRGAAALDGKPVAVLGASPSLGGTASAREHLVAILARAGARPLPSTVGIPAAHQAFTDGTLHADHVDAVEQLMRDLESALLPA